MNFFRSYRSTTPVIHPALGLVLGISTLLLAGGCRRTPEQSYGRLIEQGRALLKSENYSGALQRFRSAEELLPKRPDAYYEHALAYMYLGWTRDASIVAARVLHLDHSHRGAQLLLARLTIEMGTPPDVLQVREGLLVRVREHPGDEEAAFLLAAADTRLEAYSEARDVLQREISTGRVPSAKLPVALAMLDIFQRKLDAAKARLQEADSHLRKSAVPLISLARLDLFQGNIAEAQREFAAALGRDPSNAEGLLGQAAVYLRGGNWRNAEAIYKELATGRDKRYRLVLADFLLDLRRYDEAIAEYSRLYSHDAGDRAVRRGLLQAYVAAGRLNDAEQLLATVLKKNPNDLEALLPRAEIAMAAGKLNEAETALQGASRLEPTSPDVHYLLARLYGVRNAKELQAGELAECVRLQPEFLQARTELARVLLSQGAFESALKVLEGAPAEERDEPDLMIERAWVLFCLGRTRDAGDLVQLVGDHSSAMFLNGLLKLVANSVNDGNGSLLKAFSTNPQDLRPLAVVIEGYIARNEVNKALNILREFTARMPGSGRVQLFMGSICLRTGNLAEAREAFTAAKTADPSLLDADLGLAQADATEGKLQSAARILTSVLAKNRNHSVALLLLASVEETAGNAESAIEHYTTVTQLEPENVVALNNLAFLTAREGRAVEALGFAQKAKEVKPDEPEVSDTLGWCLYKIGQYRAAAEQFRQAMKQDSSNAAFQAHLGLAQLKLGDRTSGVQSVNAALQSDPRLAQQLSLELSQIVAWR